MLESDRMFVYTHCLTFKGNNYNVWIFYFSSMRLIKYVSVSITGAYHGLKGRIEGLNNNFYQGRLHWYLDQTLVRRLNLGRKDNPIYKHTKSYGCFSIDNTVMEN